MFDSYPMKTCAAVILILLLHPGAAAQGQSQVSVEQGGGLMLPRPFVRSVLFGVGAGTLVGVAAITNFKRDFSRNVDSQNIFRGASYGLYAGILLGLLTLGDTADTVHDEEINDTEAGTVYYNSKIKSKIALHEKSEPTLKIIPLLEAETICGLYVSWTALRF